MVEMILNHLKNAEKNHDGHLDLDLDQLHINIDLYVVIQYIHILNHIVYQKNDDKK